MNEQSDIYRIAGEALKLSQMLEEALTIPIMMLFMIESGFQKDFGCEELEKMIGESIETSRSKKLQPVDKRFVQNKAVDIGQINLLIQNGTMGELKRALETRLRITPGGPSSFLNVLQDALDSRNYLCHTLFKEIEESSALGNGVFDARGKLKEIEEKLRKAISFANKLAETLRHRFPQTFAIDIHRVH